MYPFGSSNTKYYAIFSGLLAIVLLLTTCIFRSGDSKISSFLFFSALFGALCIFLKTLCGGFLQQVYLLPQDTVVYWFFMIFYKTYCRIIQFDLSASFCKSQDHSYLQIHIHIFKFCCHLPTQLYINTMRISNSVSFASFKYTSFLQALVQYF